MKRFSAAFLILMCVLCLTACREGRGDVTAKPVIYLYPEEETQVTVKLDYAGELTCTYPAYDDGWTVTAQPDGTLTDAAGQTYSYLFWEGVDTAAYDFSQGFCVAGKAVDQCENQRIGSHNDQNDHGGRQHFNAEPFGLTVCGL